MTQVGSEFLKAVVVKIVLFWYVTLCKLVRMYQHFERTFSLLLQYIGLCQKYRYPYTIAGGVQGQL